MTPESSRSRGQDEPNAPLIARALSDQGEAALYAGDLTAAAATLREAVARWRKLDEPDSLAEALNNLGVTYARMKQPKRAIPLLTEAAAVCKAAGKHAGEAAALNALGAVYADLGDHQQALAHLRAALPLRREAGDAPGEALTLDLLARVCATTGDPLAALDYRRQELQAVRATGERKSEAAAMVRLAGTLLAAGYDTEAVTTLTEAAAIYEQLGHLREAGQTLLQLAQTHVEAGNMAGAIPPVEKGLPMLRQAGAWDLRAEQWESFLFSHRVQQQLQGALGQWRRGEPAGIEAIVEAARVRMDATSANFASPVSNQLLDILANSAARLAGMTPAQPAPKQPTTDDLAAQDTRSTPDLIDALRSTEAPERRKAALALGVRGNLAAVEPLIAACDDRNQWVRMAAVRSLGKLKAVPALDAIAKRAEEDRDKEVRRSAATALGALGDKRAVEALTIALTDSYYRTVESAEKALRKLKAAPSFDILLALLTHKDGLRRYAATERLARLGDVRAVQPLAREAENPGQPVEIRVAMLKALARLNDYRGVEAALRVLETAHLPGATLNKGTQQPDVLLKQAALNTIAALANPSVVPSLTPRLLPYLGEESPYVRHAAVKALGAAGDAGAIPALERIQQADDEAIQTISESGVQRARLRTAAAEAIDRIRVRAAG